MAAVGCPGWRWEEEEEEEEEEEVVEASQYRCGEGMVRGMARGEPYRGREGVEGLVKALGCRC